MFAGLAFDIFLRSFNLFIQPIRKDFEPRAFGLTRVVQNK